MPASPEPLLVAPSRAFRAAMNFFTFSLMAVHSSGVCKTDFQHIRRLFAKHSQGPTLSKKPCHAMDHSSPKNGETPTARMPEPIEKPFGRVMCVTRGTPVRLGVFNIDLVDMVTPTFSQGLSEGTERNHGGILPANGHVVAQTDQLICQPLHEIDNRRVARRLRLLTNTLDQLLVHVRTFWASATTLFRSSRFCRR